MKVGSMKTSSDVKNCITGIEGLDDYLGSFPCRGLIVVLGHPGSGKTTFVSQLAYMNAVKLGRKTLFISLYENKEVLIENLKLLGIDFEYLEKQGLLKLEFLPTVSSSEILEQLITVISDSISTFDPDIIVIDGISSLLESLESSRARAFLHSILYRVAHTNKKLVIAVADLPWGSEASHLGGIEFIADAVFIMKTKIEQHRLLRFLEIRKFRGKQTPIAEIPFSIIQGVGIGVLMPFKMVYYHVKEEALDLSLLCKELHEKMGSLLVPHGTQILVLHDHGSEIPRIMVAALAKLALMHRLKFVIITFGEPIEGLRHTLQTLYDSLGVPREEAENYIKLYGVNPTEVWVYGSRLEEFRIMEIEQPQMVALVGLQTVKEITSDTEFVTSQLNDVLRYKSMGVTVFRFHAETAKHVPTAEYSDVVIRMRIQYDDKDSPLLVIDVLKSLQPLKMPLFRKKLSLDYVYRCILAPIEQSHKD